MNKLNELDNLAAWCKQYGEDNGIKLFPTTAPLEIVVDEILARLKIIEQKSHVPAVTPGDASKLTIEQEELTKEKIKVDKKAVTK